MMANPHHEGHIARSFPVWVPNGLNLHPWTWPCTSALLPEGQLLSNLLAMGLMRKGRKDVKQALSLYTSAGIELERWWVAG